jgi:biopolymer transport protein ExbD
MSGKKKRKPKFTQQGDDLDLVPLIDVVFLILLFFILCGRLTLDQRTEQITVPPTRTAQKLPETRGWERVVVNVYGSTQNGKPPRNSIAMPPLLPWYSDKVDDYTGYQHLRQELNKIHDKVEKYDDPKGTGMKLPKAIIEIRADAETEYRVVQEIQQVLSDTVDPFNNMLPKVAKPSELKSFVNIDFTTRKPGEN